MSNRAESDAIDLGVDDVARNLDSDTLAGFTEIGEFCFHSCSIPVGFEEAARVNSMLGSFEMARGRHSAPPPAGRERGRSAAGSNGAKGGS